MKLTFIPKKKNIAVMFEADQATPGNDVTTGSRKAPQQRHFYSEIRLNPDALALILRPRATLTRYASEWQAVSDDRFTIEDTSTFGAGIYKLMGWENTMAYSISGTVVSPQASHFKSAVELRTAAGRESVTVPDTARIGDYYFNLKEAMNIAPPDHDQTLDHDHAFDHETSSRRY